ncbi:MAG: aspartate carbamoyltransferase regulatory subunit [Verrucomicrobia bacterium]|nr:aspartate carbamoyltransferase regulatory subunit [Verrucomicrobiota bacterium]
MKEKTLSVSAIKEGTVIDHIAAGQALKIVRLLKLNAHEHQVTLGLNLKSGSMGLKDIIKVENMHLNERQAAQIAVFSPSATVNVIENYKVSKKFRVELPRDIAGILVCPNRQCVTHVEPVSSVFIVQENNSRVVLRCRFCEKSFSRDELHEKVYF